MAGVTAIQGVDDTLKKLTTDAVAGLTEKPEVTVGPLDRDSDDAPAELVPLPDHARIPPYRNMEPPRTGWRTRRADARRLRSSFIPADRVPGERVERRRPGAVRARRRSPRRCRRCTPTRSSTRPIPALSPLAKPLVEPLRITLDALDLEAISKLWTATTQPLRLSVGYEVSLVVVDALQQHVAGPPVRERRVAVAPTHRAAPRLGRPAARELHATSCS